MPTRLAASNDVTTINGVVMDAEAGTLNLNVTTDEISNSGSGGYYEDMATLKQATISGGRFVYDGEDPPDFEAGYLVELSVTFVNGPSLTGTFRVGSVSVPALDVKAALHYSFDLTSQGPYTWSWGGTP